MAAIDNPHSLGDGRLGFASEKDVDLFVEMLEKFERGEVGPDEWRAFRLVNGVYGQRQDDVQMIRVKIPGGILTVPQLNILADVADRYAGGKGHITTRQNIQYHFVKLAEAAAALRELAVTGLTTKEACGNAVRNVTMSPYAGVDPDEAFDVTPYGEAVVRHLLRGPYSSKLPRKFKIAFGGKLNDDDIGAFFHDVGYLARVVDGKLGFKVVAGGGLSTLRRAAITLHEFAPFEEINEIAEAVVRLFDRTGDRQHRHKARLKFVVQKLGNEKFLAEYQIEREKIRAEGGRPVELPAQPSLKEKSAALRPGALGFDTFRAKNVRRQAQAGYSSVTLKITLGDLTSAQFRGLASLVHEFSAEEELRLTVEQNLVIRFVRDEHLASVHAALVALDLADAGPLTVLDVTSCPGAMSCKLAVTQSRGLASHVQAHLEARPELVAKAESLSIKASGCPNSCGQHHVAGLGFQGGMKKLGSRSAPLYHLYVGGSMGAQGATFGRLAAKVPARRAGQVTERLIELYAAEKREGEEPNQFFARIELERVKTALAGLLDIDESTATEQDYIDLGETQAFEVSLQEGECAA